MRTEYRIVRELDKNNSPAFDMDGDPVYSLERKTKLNRWKHLDWSWNKQYLIERAEKRFKKQKATEFILIDETAKEFTLKDGKVYVAA